MKRISDEVIERYTHRDCAQLAWLLHVRTGFPLAFVATHETMFDTFWVHSGVQLPDETILDVEGLHDFNLWLDDYEGWHDPDVSNGVFLAISHEKHGERRFFGDDDEYAFTPQEMTDANQVATILLDAISVGALSCSSDQ